MVGKPTLNSGNTLGASYWLDNKRRAPMLPDYPDLGRCPHCGVLMRQSLARKAEVSEEFAYSLPDGADWMQNPTENDWVESLQSVMWKSADEEIYARLAAWHAANDSVREQEGKPEFSNAALDNLRALDELLGAGDEPYFVVLRAEIARETGDFDSALAWLEHADPKFEQVTTQIAALARAKDTRIKRRNI